MPFESAYPGFGECVVLHGVNHINVCKPGSRQDPSYAKTTQLLQRAAEKARAAQQPQQGRQGGGDSKQAAHELQRQSLAQRALLPLRGWAQAGCGGSGDAGDGAAVPAAAAAAAMAASAGAHSSPAPRAAA